MAPTPSWLGYLLGFAFGGGLAGLLSVIAARARDRTQAKAMDNSFALDGLKYLQAQHVADIQDMARKDQECADQKAALDAVISDLKHQLAIEKRRRK